MEGKYTIKSLDCQKHIADDAYSAHFKERRKQVKGPCSQIECSVKPTRGEKGMNICQLGNRALQERAYTKCIKKRQRLIFMDTHFVYQYKRR